MLKKRPYTVTMAICYDFDGTLAPGNMQEYGFIEKLNMTPDTFWKKSNTLAKTQKVDNILHISTKNAPTYRIIDILDFDTAEPTFWSVIKE